MPHLGVLHEALDLSLRQLIVPAVEGVGDVLLHSVREHVQREDRLVDIGLLRQAVLPPADP